MEFDYSKSTADLFRKTYKEAVLDWEEELMYESPIRMIADQMQTKMEADCVSVVQSYGFDVDAEELKKALAYDRDQYDKGFKDARTVPVIIHNVVFENGAGCSCPDDVHGYLDKSRNLLFLKPGIAAEFAAQMGWVIEEIKEPFGGAEK